MGIPRHMRTSSSSPAPKRSNKRSEDVYESDSPTNSLFRGAAESAISGPHRRLNLSDTGNEGGGSGAVTKEQSSGLVCNACFYCMYTLFPIACILYFLLHIVVLYFLLHVYSIGCSFLCKFLQWDVYSYITCLMSMHVHTFHGHYMYICTHTHNMMQVTVKNLQCMQCLLQIIDQQGNLLDSAWFLVVNTLQVNAVK